MLASRVWQSNDLVLDSSTAVSTLSIAGLGLTPGISVLTTRKSGRNEQRPSGWKEGDQGHAGRKKSKKAVEHKRKAKSRKASSDGESTRMSKSLANKQFDRERRREVGTGAAVDEGRASEHYHSAMNHETDE